MKKIKIILLALTITVFISCSSSASFLASQVYIGMPMSDFIAVSQGKAKLDSMKDGWTIYKAYDRDVNGYVKDTKFFYFDSNSKLAQMDGGVRQQDRQKIDIIRK